MPAGTPGWVGRAVDLVSVTAEGARKVEAEVSLDAADRLICSRPELLERWAREGIVGRAQLGRLFPTDGQAFLDELPFVYKSIYLMAVPRRDEALT